MAVRICSLSAPLDRALAASILLLAGPAQPGFATTAAEVGGCAGTVAERVISAGPSTYRDELDTLEPGDLLQLAGGTYLEGLPLNDLHGEPDRCIVIEGPASGAPALFQARSCCNTIDLSDVSYLVIRNLELDGQDLDGVDAVKASLGGPSHHVTIENLYIYGHGGSQQTVGISTKEEAWNWVIRRNRIEGAGTGIYLGDSDGDQEFVAGLIEHNLITDTLGYNLQIKHQTGRDTGLGIPAQATTIIRHNVLSKAQNGSTGGDARPNLLVGHWPLVGDGADDVYQIYGNFFWQNPTGEPLFQGEGNLALHHNLLVNDQGSALAIQAHEDVPREIHVFQNTVVASGEGIRISDADLGYLQEVIGNAVFAATPLQGGSQADNVAYAYADAGLYLNNPDGALSGGDRLDLYPLPGNLSGPALDLADQQVYEDWDRDFNGTTGTATWRGAYAGEGSNPGWQPALEIKPDGLLFADGFESGDTSAWSVTFP